jgi:hypothetical protein
MPFGENWWGFRQRENVYALLNWRACAQVKRGLFVAADICISFAKGWVVVSSVFASRAWRRRARASSASPSGWRFAFLSEHRLRVGVEITRYPFVAAALVTRAMQACLVPLRAGKRAGLFGAIAGLEAVSTKGTNLPPCHILPGVATSRAGA